MLAQVRSHPLWILCFILLTLVIGTAIASPTFRKLENIANLLNGTVPLGFIALGQTCAMLMGGVDLSVGSLASIITALGALLVKPDSTTWSVLLWLVGALVTSVLFGIGNATIITKLRIPPLIATLCTGIIGQGIALSLIPRPSGYIPRSRVAFLAYEHGFFSLPVLYFIIFIVLGYFFFRYIRLGRYIYAVGGNRKSAEIAGLNVNLIVVKGYILTSLFAGLGGIFLTCRIGCGDPTVGNPFALDSVVAALIGGTTFSGGEGGIMGTIVGALFITTIANALNMLRVPSFYQYVLKGALFTMAVAIYSRAKVMHK